MLSSSTVMLEETVPLPCRACEGITASKGTKELAGATELFGSLAYEQRHLLRAANLDAGFLLHFTIYKIQAPTQSFNYPSGTNV